MAAILHVLACALVLTISPISLQSSLMEMELQIIYPAHAKDGKGYDNSGKGSKDSDRGSDNDNDDVSQKSDNSSQSIPSSDGQSSKKNHGSDDKSDNSYKKKKSRSKGITRVEMSPYRVVIFYADGTHEAVENDRYEFRDANDRVIEGRHATAADLSRLRSRANGLSVKSVVVPQSSRAAGSEIVKIEKTGEHFSILYGSGWKEEITDGVYQLKDPNWNTVVKRPATKKDSYRFNKALRD